MKLLFFTHSISVLNVSVVKFLLGCKRNQEYQLESRNNKLIIQINRIAIWHQKGFQSRYSVSCHWCPCSAISFFIYSLLFGTRASQSAVSVHCFFQDHFFFFCALTKIYFGNATKMNANSFYKHTGFVYWL